jgi:hypothetical protein
MRQPSQRFTLAVTGSGSLQGMFFTEIMQRFPHAQVFDRSNGMNQARAGEAGLGQTEYASPEFRRLAIKTQSNLLDPPPTDVTVDFFHLANMDTVSVTSRGFNKRLSCTVTSATSIDERVAFLKKVCDAVAQS